MMTKETKVVEPEVIDVPPETQLPVQTEVASPEVMDDEIIMDMIAGNLIDKYVYSFTPKGSKREITGLTLAGVIEAARRKGGIKITSYKYEDHGHSWLAIVEAEDINTGSSRIGAFEQTKKMGSRPDEHAFTKAVHKAQRNAIRQLLPKSVIEEVLAAYKEHHSNGKDKPKDALPQPETETEKTDKPIDKARKKAFAVLNQLQPKLNEIGIDKDMFTKAVRLRFGVASRTQMTVKQHETWAAQMSNALKNKEAFEAMVAKSYTLLADNVKDKTGNKLDNEVNNDNNKGTTLKQTFTHEDDAPTPQEPPPGVGDSEDEIFAQ